MINAGFVRVRRSGSGGVGNRASANFQSGQHRDHRQTQRDQNGERHLGVEQ